MPEIVDYSRRERKRSNGNTLAKEKLICQRNQTVCKNVEMERP